MSMKEPTKASAIFNLVADPGRVIPALTEGIAHVRLHRILKFKRLARDQ